VAFLSGPFVENSDSDSQRQSIWVAMPLKLRPVWKLIGLILSIAHLHEAQHVLAFHPDQHLADVTKITEIEKADYEGDGESQPEQDTS